MSSKQQFADAVSREKCLWRLFRVLERPQNNEHQDKVEAGSEEDEPRKRHGWLVLEALSSSPSIAMQLFHTSGWIELLGVLVGYSKFTRIWSARVGAAKTLSRLLWDPATGPLAGK
jgi:hypothetical protein